MAVNTIALVLEATLVLARRGFSCGTCAEL